MAADDPLSWVKKRKTFPALSDVGKSFMEFVSMNKNRFAGGDDSRTQFLLRLLPDVKEMTDNQMSRFKRKAKSVQFRTYFPAIHLNVILRSSSLSSKRSLSKLFPRQFLDKYMCTFSCDCCNNTRIAV